MLNQAIRKWSWTLGVLLLSATAWARPIPPTVWLFDDNNAPLAASAGEDLIVSGEFSYVQGMSASDGAIQIEAGTQLQGHSGLAPSDDNDAYIAEYSLAVDILVPGAESPLHLLETGINDDGAHEFSINSAGGLGSAETGYSADGSIGQGWHRVLMAVSLSGTGGAVDYYLDGTHVKRAEPAFWESIYGTNPIREAGPFALPAGDSAQVTFFPDNGTQVTISAIAWFNHALTEAEARDLGAASRKFLLRDVPGETRVSFSEFQNLAAGNYETVILTGIAGVADVVRLEEVTVDTPGYISDLGDGYFAYFGQGIRVGDFTTTEAGYTLSCTFQMPGFLGGMAEGVDFLLSSSGITIDGGHFELPDVDDDGLKIQRVTLDIDPEAGSYSAAGGVQLPLWSNGIAGSISLQAGLGPEVFGTRLMDVTEISLKATGLSIPVADVFIMDQIGASIADPYGLSNPANWANAVLGGMFRLVTEPKFTIGGRSYYLYAFTVNGDLALHDGSFTLTGTGNLMNTINLNTSTVHFDPPYYMKTDTKFDALGIFTGDLNTGLSAGDVSGHLDGWLGIPKTVPVVGGLGVGAEASLHNTRFTGAIDITVLPEIPSICTPRWCPPQLCISWWSCHNTCWAWIFPYPCNCYVSSGCWQPPCIPPICTPYIPPVKVHFGFTFDAGTGDFGWAKEGPYNTWEVPIHAPIKQGDENGAFYVMTNWYVVDSATTTPARSTQKRYDLTKQGAQKATFTIDTDVPAALFRLNYEDEAATAVDMTVTTPGGDTLQSSEGALPTGFSTVSGYSRFNPDAREQVIVLLSPAQGDYTVTVNNPDDLGQNTVDLVIQDHLPSGEITSIEEGAEQGSYTIAWTDDDVEGPNSVRILLDHDRQHRDGFLVAELDETENTGSYTLDTTALNMHAGDYFVMLEVDDGVNEPFSFYSHDTIRVIPDGTPETPTGLQFLPDDGAVHFTWNPCTSEEVTGYLLMLRLPEEDLGHFDQRFYVAADTTPLGATIEDLENDQPVLATVVAMTSDLKRSLPADIVRVVPHAPATASTPRIVSTPDTDATAAQDYSYIPVLADDSYGQSYVWSLDTAPADMTCDPDSGLIQWTPDEEEAGEQPVTLRLTKDGDTSLSTTQDFTIQVYSPELLNGVEPHAYSVVSSPATRTADPTAAALAKQGTAQYTYQMAVHGPTSDLEYELAAGPEGMSIDQNGLITWDVPEGADGAWVRVLVTAEGEHKLDQDFYLHVQKESHFPITLEPEDQKTGLLACGATQAQTHSLMAKGAGIALLAALMSLVLLHRKLRKG